jgi:putative ATP-dependent endonuclease of OLD family
MAQSQFSRLTSHSPDFASIAHISSLTCLVDTGSAVEAFSPATSPLRKESKKKMERYLDVKRAEIFFARRVIFVEGAAEPMLGSGSEPQAL